MLLAIMSFCLLEKIGELRCCQICLHSGNHFTYSTENLEFVFSLICGFYALKLGSALSHIFRKLRYLVYRTGIRKTNFYHLEN